MWSSTQFGSDPDIANWKSCSDILQDIKKTRKCFPPHHSGWDITESPDIDLLQGINQKPKIWSPHHSGWECIAITESLDNHTLSCRASNHNDIHILQDINRNMVLHSGWYITESPTVTSHMQDINQKARNMVLTMTSCRISTKVTGITIQGW